MHACKKEGGFNIQEVSTEKLKQLIDEGKKAGKDVSKLEATLHTLTLTAAVKPKLGEKKVVKKTEKGTVVIESTGPAKEEDFE